MIWDDRDNPPRAESPTPYWRGFMAGIIFGLWVGGLMGIVIHAYTTNTLFEETSDGQSTEPGPQTRSQ